MSKTKSPREYEPIRIRGARYKRPDARKVARAVIELARREAAREETVQNNAAPTSADDLPTGQSARKAGRHRE